MMLMYIPVLALGYLFGCVNLAWTLGKLRGFDIRSYGSMNAGASNAVVTIGLGAGIAVGACDILKSCIAAILVAHLFPDLPAAGAIAGTAAILGHIFPFYLKFRGGKGFASFLGLILALDWKFFLLITAAILLILLITDYITIGTLTTIVSFPVYLLITHAAWLQLAAVIVAAVLIFIRHLVNIHRLLQGEEIGLRRALKKKDKVR